MFVAEKKPLCKNSICLLHGFAIYLVVMLHCRKKKVKGDKNRPISNEVPAAAEDQAPTKEPITEAERLLMQR